MRAVLIAVWLGVAMVAQSAPPPADFATASVGTVVVVTTANGQPVLDVAPTELVVLVDDRPARVEYMQAVGRALTGVLMLNVSRSMFGKLDYRVGEELGRHVVPALRSADRVRFGEIGGTVAVGSIAPHTKAFFAAPPPLLDRPEAQPLRSLMSSPIWDGVAAAVAAIRDDDRHRLVVLVTDGLVSGSRLGFEDALRLATAAQTVVSVVDMHTAEWMAVKQDHQRERERFRPDEALRKLAAGTGGSYYADAHARGERPRKTDYSEMPRLVVKAIAESRGAYRISLQIPSDGAPRSLKITSNRPGLVIRTPSEIRP